MCPFAMCITLGNGLGNTPMVLLNIQITIHLITDETLEGRVLGTPAEENRILVTDHPQEEVVVAGKALAHISKTRTTRIPTIINIKHQTHKVRKNLKEAIMGVPSLAMDRTKKGMVTH